MKDEITQRYAEKIIPILYLAKRAYGLRGQNTAAHVASGKYTELVKEYYANGGSLVSLASELDVAYSGLRRRVFSSNVPPVVRKKRSRATEDAVSEAIDRVRSARDTSTEVYHEELHRVYHEGISLAVIAKGLSISSSAPLYYGVQRHEIRVKDGE